MVRHGMVWYGKTSKPYPGQVQISRSFVQGQGHFSKWAFQTIRHQITLLSPAYGDLGQDHLKVKVIPELNCKCMYFYLEAGGGPSTVSLFYFKSWK